MTCSAFSNARVLARDGVGSSLLELLHHLWKEEQIKEEVSVACQICNSIRLLAANDEICKDMVDRGVLQVLLLVIKHSLGELSNGKPDLTVSSMALFRQLLASDTVKSALDKTEFCEIVSYVLQLYLDDSFSDSSNRVVEHTLGSVSAMCLRNPDASEALVEYGSAQLIVRCMKTMIESKESDKRANIGKCLRQGCMSIRNIASRSPQIRDALKSYDTIEVIEQAKIVAKAACTDVGDAAIRDVTG